MASNCFVVWISWKYHKSAFKNILLSLNYLNPIFWVQNRPNRKTEFRLIQFVWIWCILPREKYFQTIFFSENIVFASHKQSAELNMQPAAGNLRPLRCCRGIVGDHHAGVDPTWHVQGHNWSVLLAECHPANCVQHVFRVNFPDCRWSTCGRILANLVNFKIRSSPDFIIF